MDILNWIYEVKTYPPMCLPGIISDFGRMSVF